MQTSKYRSLNIGAVAVLNLIALAPAVAEPLPKDTCDVLAAQQQTLLAAGVKEDFARGADWGKANLKTDRLAQIARYIDLEEQLNFRCGLAKVRFTLPPDEDTAAAATAAAEQAKTDANPQDGPATKSQAAKPQAPKSQAPKSQAKPEAPSKPAAKLKAADVEATQPTNRPVAKIQAKVKPKVDDAFKPAPASEKE